MERSFKALEVYRDGHVEFHPFSIVAQEGHVVMKRDQVEVSRGEVVLKTLFCGICSTDFFLKDYPFVLPVVPGHEVVACSLDNPNLWYAVEINTFCGSCHTCCHVSHTQCTKNRLTLGIDRLPGGYAPFFLSPLNLLHPLPEELKRKGAVFVEPFAAALHAVDTALKDYNPSLVRVAVVGVKKLGVMMVAALAVRRICHVKWYGRSQRADEVCRKVWKAVNMPDEEGKKKSSSPQEEEEGEGEVGCFDVVFECSGSVSGFERSVRMVRRGGKIHLKSTAGHSYGKVSYLARAVVRELTLIISPKPSDLKKKNNSDEKGETPDKVFVSSFAQLNDVLSRDDSVLARGTIVCDFSENKEWDECEVWREVRRCGVERVESSRCGQFERAICELRTHLGLVEVLEKEMVTHEYGLHEADRAYKVARDDKTALKVVLVGQKE